MGSNEQLLVSVILIRQLADQDDEGSLGINKLL